MSQIFIISAPSGAGKTTICKKILEQSPNIAYSVSYTTRKPRNGEKHGIDYYYISVEEFEQGIKNDKWAEWAKVHDNYYGTSSVFLQKCLNENTHVLLDIDVQGAKKIMANFPKTSVPIFIMPPSIEELKHRLTNRQTDSPDVIEKRLNNALTEIKHKDDYKHIVVNDQLDLAMNEIIKIIESADEN